MKKLLISVVTVLLACLLVGYWYVGYYQEKASTTKVYGNVDIYQVSLAFEGSGRIVALNYREGARVHKGDVLGKLDTTNQELVLAQKLTSKDIAQEKLTLLRNGFRVEEIEAARARLNQAKAQEHFAQITYNRKARVFKNTHGKGISQAEVDEAKASLDVAIASTIAAQNDYNLKKSGNRIEEIRLAELELELITKEIATLQDTIARGTLIAPQDGVIRTRYAEVGDMASPSSLAYGLLLTTDKWVRAYVDYNQLPLVNLGKEVTISFANGKTLTGKVGFISDSAEFTPKNVETEDLRTNLVYEVRIVAIDKNDELRLGMPVTVILAK